MRQEDAVSSRLAFKQVKPLFLPGWRWEVLPLPWPFHPVLLTFTSSSQPLSLLVPISPQSPPLSVPTPSQSLPPISPHPFLVSASSQSPPPRCPRLLSAPASSQSPPLLSPRLLSIPTPLSPHPSQSPPPLLCFPWRGGFRLSWS